MKEIERIGLLKMDFLGLSTLTLIHDALEQIASTTGVRVVMEDLPLTDAKTFDLFCEAQTLGVFQFESLGHAADPAPGEAAQVRGPDRAQRALPPGPDQGRHDRRLREPRNTGAFRSSTELESMRPILEDTYGVMAYQEQVMRVAQRAGRVHARRGRPAAQGHGQEEPCPDAGAAGEVRRRGRRAGHQRRRRPRACST